MSGNILFVSCLTLIGIATALLATSLGTTHWFEITSYDPDIANVHEGLFKYCTGDHCITYDYTPDDLKAIQGMLFSALILNVIGFIVMVHCGLTGSKISTKIHAWSCFFTCGLAGILGIASVARYVVENDDPNTLAIWNFGFSLHLAWLSSILSIVGGCIAIPVVNHFLWGGHSTGHVTGYAQPVVVQTVQHNMAYPVVQGYPFPPQQQYWGPAQQPTGAYPPNAYGNPPAKPM